MVLDIMFTSAKKLYYILPILSIVCLAIGVGIGKYWQSTTTLPTTSQPTKVANLATTPTAVMTVEAIYPRAQSTYQTLEASGVIAGKEVAQVGAKVNGVAITSVLVKVGDYVKAGQVLARLDDSASREQTVIATAELEQAKATLDKARADLERVTPLVEIDAISREAFDAYKTAERQAQENVNALTARLATSRTSQNNTHLVAPVSGIISDKQAQVGMIATGTPLFSIIKYGTLEWQASIPATQANKITIGQLAELNVAGEKLTAHVDRLSPIANNSREITVHATLPASSAVRAGMYQRGHFLLGTAEHLTLPYSAISTSDGMDYIWTLTPSEHDDLYRVRRTSVQVLAHQKDVVAVVLPASTLVVEKSGNFLSEGNLVKIAHKPEPAPVAIDPAQGETP